MNKYILILVILISLGCSNYSIDYSIEKGKVGKINSETIIKDLDSLFSNDSIVKRIGEGDYMFSGEDKYLIYDKEQNHLLTLTPKQQHDLNEKIETIEVISEKFKTNKGININSTFYDIKINHKISSIQNTISNIVIFVDEIDTYFVIDKSNLPINLRRGTDIKIEEINIPPKSKIKRFMIGWN